MSTRDVILIASGADRPGVLDDISLYLHERAAGILDSRVCLLRGQFAMLLLVRADDAALQSVASGLAGLEGKTGVRLELREAGAHESRDATPVRLTARGPDAAAVLHRLSHLMRVLNVNIENIRTTALPAVGTAGRPGARFELDVGLSVPRATPLMMLKQYVDSLAEEVGFEADIRAE